MSKRLRVSSGLIRVSVVYLVNFFKVGVIMMKSLICQMNIFAYFKFLLARHRIKLLVARITLSIAQMEDGKHAL